VRAFGGGGGVIGKILLVEDDPRMARVLRDNLRVDGFDVVLAGSGAAALQEARQSRPDLVLLDLMLPDTDGFQLCAELRRAARAPIIILTARGETADLLRALDSGADDFVTKPLDLQELLARVRALLRRARPAVRSIRLGDIVVDFQAHVATAAGRNLHLTHREFAILQFLAERTNRIVSRDELLREIWGYAERPVTRSVDHAIARLRQKLEDDPRRARYIHTAHGGGYCLTPGGRSPRGRAARRETLR
jgi:DNA-binding response OmpR family regulator